MNAFRLRPLVRGVSLLVALLTVLPLAAAEYSSNLAKAFAVKPGGKLIVDSDRGSITLTTGASGDEVRIDVRRTVRGGSRSRAEEIFAAHQVAFEQDGDRVEVRAKQTQPLKRGFWQNEENFQVEYLVTLPEKFSLDLNTSAGSISCGNLEGTVKAKTAGGSLKFGNVNGPFDGTTSAGSIQIGIVSGKLKASTSGGSIKVNRAGGDTDLQTSAGSITVGVCQGRLKAGTSGGGMELGELTGPAEAHTSAGSIRVKFAQAPLKLSTSGGSITIDEAREAVSASTSAGSIQALFAAQPTADSRLVTSGGSITVKLNSELSFDLDARADGGRVSTEIPVTTTILGDQPRDHVTGKINSGGKALVLKTSAGGVKILKQ